MAPNTADTASPAAVPKRKPRWNPQVSSLCTLRFALCTWYRLRTGSAVVAAWLAGAVSRATGRGGGTALPGLLAERIDPDVLRTLARQLPRGAVVVTGTNGKTTTSHMLTGILRRAGLHPLRNASGSNLARGIATAMAAHADWTGRLRAPANTVGLFETDEAAFARVVPAVEPRVIVVTNLFRDQLDRYGEVDTVAGIWREALRVETGRREGAGAGTLLVLNADDPTVAALGSNGTGFPQRSLSLRGDGQEVGPPVVYFGLDDVRWGHEGPEHAADAKVCPACGARLRYPVCFYGHIGHYTCTSGHRRPDPAVRAIRVDFRGLAGTEIMLATPDGELGVTLPVPGLHNVYNALAAAAAAYALRAPLPAIRAGLEAFSAAFGRLERVEVGGRTVFLVLAKNPVGMNEALRTLALDAAPKHLLLALNDLDADGRDVSWIWDADFERLAGQVRSLTVSGRRAEDLAVRLKYAGVLDALLPSPLVGEGPGVRGSPAAHVEPDLARALDGALSQTAPGETLYVVLTYTAMLALRRVLTDRGHAAPYWEDDAR
ncbi:MAG: DUF1727 domain-containing protein [Chloroflexi bacterium]|nr:DUF1727 domain-containing protein [Chloroflexota bacterium]